MQTLNQTPPAPFDPNYTYYMQTAGGRLVGSDIEVRIEAAARIVSSFPEIAIERVLIDTWHRERGRIVNDGAVDMLSDPVLRPLGMQIAEAALTDDSFVEELLREAGITYRGLGGNDPEGRWVRTGEPAA